MTEDELLDRFGISPTVAELDEVRSVLTEHTAKERRCQGDGDTEVMKLCCVQLFSVGSLRDVLMIWAAKSASFDAAASIDVQLLCGAGLKKTKRFLRKQSERKADAALRYILQCEDSGDFDDFSPTQRLEVYRRYYGIRNEGPR